MRRIVVQAMVEPLLRERLRAFAKGHNMSESELCRRMLRECMADSVVATAIRTASLRPQQKLLEMSNLPKVA